ncbi:MAG: N-acetylmuramoyl-L-alanine amidase [Syntrophobacterales bacterium]|jgi:N-acetylmuramoyl-L-alanine amidase
MRQLVDHLMVWGMAFFLLGTTISDTGWAREFRLAIDIGHTLKSPGAISARGVPEYFFNKNIATHLYKRLKQDKRFKGSFLINESGDNISLATRTAIAQRRGADLLLAIHHDSVYPEDLSYWLHQGKIMPYCDKFAGYSIFYSEKNGRPVDSLKFAIILGTAMLRAGFCPTLHHVKHFTGDDKALMDKTRGIYKYNQLIVLKNSTMPAVLFECGIIKNKQEELQLSLPKYQAKLVEALFQAVKKYAESTK